VKWLLLTHAFPFPRYWSISLIKFYSIKSAPKLKNACIVVCCLAVVFCLVESVHIYQLTQSNVTINYSLFAFTLFHFRGIRSFLCNHEEEWCRVEVKHPVCYCNSQVKTTCLSEKFTSLMWKGRKREWLEINLIEKQKKKGSLHSMDERSTVNMNFLIWFS
jgi:hypothetical protein